MTVLIQINRIVVFPVTHARAIGMLSITDIIHDRVGGGAMAAAGAGGLE